MGSEQRAVAPEENFKSGLREVAIADFDLVAHGTVRDVYRPHGSPLVAIITTDRQSAFGHVVCTIPGKGAVLNGMSSWWLENTSDLVRNHALQTPHPNVLIARYVPPERQLPFEVIVHDYMARTNSLTSFYPHYQVGERTIHEYNFPDRMKANERLDQTMVTAAYAGYHEQPLNHRQAAVLLDRRFSTETWEKVVTAAYALFERGRSELEDYDLILADATYKFAVDDDGEVMIIGELHTPDSSRIWLANTYEARLAAGEDPEGFDTEVLKRWLEYQGFSGEEGQAIPVVDPRIIAKMAAAYRRSFEMLDPAHTPGGITREDVIKHVVLEAFQFK